MFALARQIFQFRDLLRSLIGRELKARYRGSLLGFFWSLVNPALLLLVYSFVFGIVFRPRAEAEGTSPYALSW
jgi:homopolymeric O-antigen transport system permease protein